MNDVILYLDFFRFPSELLYHLASRRWIQATVCNTVDTVQVTQC